VKDHHWSARDRRDRISGGLGRQGWSYACVEAGDLNDLEATYCLADRRIQGPGCLVSVNHGVAWPPGRSGNSATQWPMVVSVLGVSYFDYQLGILLGTLMTESASYGRQECSTPHGTATGRSL
jgi:hypothetical protein